MRLVLGNKNYSSWSLRAWLVAKRCGAAFDEIVIPLDQPGYREQILAYSPSGRVPALLVGGQVIWDSMAIAEYFAERFAGADLWPEDLLQRARARAISYEMHAGFEALRQRLPMDFRATGLPFEDSPELAADVWRVVELLRETRAEFGAHGDFLFGTFGIADAMFAPVMSRFHSYALPLPAVVAGYRDAVLGMPALREWGRAAREETWVIAH